MKLCGNFKKTIKTFRENLNFQVSQNRDLKQQNAVKGATKFKTPTVEYLILLG